MLNTAAFAPMPSPSVRTTAAVNSGDLNNARSPNRTSCQSASISSGPCYITTLLGPFVRRPILPPSYERNHGHARRIELASDRQIRARNKIRYRLAHWPIWIFVFFIAPGPMTFDLFAHGISRRMLIWLGIVLLGTGIAGVLGKLPGVEPRPYIIRFTEDRPNPLYRRICYTLAWSEAITFAVLNVAGILIAMVTGRWHMREIYDAAYFPIASHDLGAGRLRPAPSREGVNER